MERAQTVFCTTLIHSGGLKQRVLNLILSMLEPIRVHLLRLYFFDGHHPFHQKGRETSTVQSNTIFTIANASLSLGDVIHPDCQIDFYHDPIDFFDTNLKADFNLS